MGLNVPKKWTKKTDDIKWSRNLEKERKARAIETQSQGSWTKWDRLVKKIT